MFIIYNEVEDKLYIFLPISLISSPLLSPFLSLSFHSVQSHPIPSLSHAAPPGVEDVYGAVMVLLAGINPHVYVQKNGRVRDKDRTWDAAKKALLSNINSFLDELKGQ